MPPASIIYLNQESAARTVCACGYGLRDSSPVLLQPCVPCVPHTLLQQTCRRAADTLFSWWFVTDRREEKQMLLMLSGLISSTADVCVFVCVCVSLLGNIIHCILTLLSCNHQQVFTWETTTTSFFVFHPLSQLHHRVTRKTEQSRWINWWLWKQFFFLKYFYINIKLAFPPSPSTHNLKGDSVGHRWEDVAESNPDHQAPVSSLFQRPLLPRTELTRQWLLNYVKSGFTVWLKKTLHFHT